MSFTAVTFYTLDSAYEAMEEAWAESLGRHGVTSFAAYAKATEGTWERNTNKKPQVIRQAWQELETPIVWLDIDAELRARPELFWELAETDVDFACHRMKRRNELLSGTLYFGQTPKAGQLLDAWCGLAERASSEWDQRNLDRVVGTVPGLKVRELPPEYCAIDFMRVTDPVVFHRQASRTEKRRG